VPALHWSQGTLVVVVGSVVGGVGVVVGGVVVVAVVTAFKKVGKQQRQKDFKKTFWMKKVSAQSQSKLNLQTNKRNHTLITSSPCRHQRCLRGKGCKRVTRRRPQRIQVRSSCSCDR
jgi:hypothetical protein